MEKQRQKAENKRTAEGFAREERIAQLKETEKKEGKRADMIKEESRLRKKIAGHRSTGRAPGFWQGAAMTMAKNLESNTNAKYGADAQRQPKPKKAKKKKQQKKKPQRRRATPARQPRQPAGYANPDDFTGW